MSNRIKRYGKKNENIFLLDSFATYCADHKGERFWQALRNWSGVEKILYEEYDETVDDALRFDTYFLTGKKPAEK